MPTISQSLRNLTIGPEHSEADERSDNPWWRITGNGSVSVEDADWLDGLMKGYVLDEVESARGTAFFNGESLELSCSISPRTGSFMSFVALTNPSADGQEVRAPLDSSLDKEAILAHCNVRPASEFGNSLQVPPRQISENQRSGKVIMKAAFTSEEWKSQIHKRPYPRRPIMKSSSSVASNPKGPPR